jgi:anti-sigma factor RsiW
MKQPAINEQLVRRYLLDDLPKRERERLEVGLLTDDRYYDTLTALEQEVEDDLIEEYLDDELTGAERENFERVFLKSPERAHKLKVIKDLKDHGARAAEPEAPAQQIVKTEPFYRQWIRAFGIFQNPTFALSSSVAVVLLVILSAGLWMRSNRLETQLIEARKQNPPDSVLKEQVDQLNRRNEELTARLQRSEEQRAAAEQQIAALKGGAGQENVPPGDNPQPGAGTVASLILTSSLRSNGNRNVPTLTLRQGVTVARLVVNVERIDPADYKRVRAIVKKQAGPEVWRNEDVRLRARGNDARAILNIDAEKLSEGLYEGILDGILSDEQQPPEPIGRYVFRVQHR